MTKSPVGQVPSGIAGLVARRSSPILLAVHRRGRGEQSRSKFLDTTGAVYGTAPVTAHIDMESTTVGRGVPSVRA